MNDFIKNIVVTKKPFDAFANSLAKELSLKKYGDSSLYNETEQDLGVLLSKYAKHGGIDSGDFYLAEEWYGTMSFGVILNSSTLVAEDALRAVAAWTLSHEFPSAVFFSGCGIEVSPDFQIAVGLGEARIHWDGKTVDQCIKRISHKRLGIL